MIADRFVEEINGYVAGVTSDTFAAIEQACEKAIQGGQYGVLVLTVNHVPVAVDVHHSVPYGVLHYREIAQ